jgi:hypothetical protein
MATPHEIRKGDCAFEEFLVLVEDGQKADLLDGVIYMASPDNTDSRCTASRTTSYYGPLARRQAISV